MRWAAYFCPSVLVAGAGARVWARESLGGRARQELRMRDVECLLVDDPARARGGAAARAPADAAGAAAGGAQEAAGAPAARAEAGRFCHMAAADVRLSDVAGLQQGYRTLCGP